MGYKDNQESMMNLHDVEVIEGIVNADKLEVAKAYQRAINDGKAWSFQSSYGRDMMRMLSAGQCLLGKEPARDYYGSYIPSRSQVKPGTMGSFQYVALRAGLDHAREMSKL